MPNLPLAAATPPVGVVAAVANATAAANRTLTRLGSRLGVNATIHGIAAGVNQTLTSLQHPVATLAKITNATAAEGAIAARLSNFTSVLNFTNATGPLAALAHINMSVLADTAALAKRLNTTAVARLTASWYGLKAAGVPLANITSIFNAVTPNPSVAGLETGAANAVQGMVALAKTLWGNTAVRNLLLTVVRTVVTSLATSVITG